MILVSTGATAINVEYKAIESALNHQRVLNRLKI